MRLALGNGYRHWGLISRWLSIISWRMHVNAFRFFGVVATRTPFKPENSWVTASRMLNVVWHRSWSPQRAGRSKKSHACINWFKQQPNQKLQSPLPDGRWTVLGPALFMNLLTSLMLANVPRDMTASLPRREPYELNSLGVNLGVRKEKAEYSTRMHYRTCSNHSLVPRPRLAFRCLQYEKAGRAWYLFSREYDIIEKLQN